MFINRRQLSQNKITMAYVCRTGQTIDNIEPIKSEHEVTVLLYDSIINERKQWVSSFI